MITFIIVGLTGLVVIALIARVHDALISTKISRREHAAAVRAQWLDINMEEN